MKPDIYPTDHHQERLQRDERREDVMTGAEAEAWREEHRSKVVTCPQCGERPTIHPDVPCQECRDADLELAGLYAPDPIEPPEEAQP